MLDKDYLLTKSDSFCILPFMHLSLHFDGSLFPCGTSSAQDHAPLVNSFDQKNFSLTWNDEKFKEFRLELLAGKKFDRCNECYRRQASGHQSLRQIVNKYFQDHFSSVEQASQNGTISEIIIPHIEIKFSNMCQLQCRICGPKYSSSNYDEHKKLGLAVGDKALCSIKENSPQYWEALKPLLGKNLKRLVFSGGEPLLTKEHNDTLQHLLQNNNTELSLCYHTSLSKGTLSEETLRQWHQFKKINIYVSLDGIEKQFEYIRSGAHWTDVVENIKCLRKTHPHIQFYGYITASIFNIFHIPDMISHFLQTNLFTPQNICLNFVSSLYPHNIQVLPPLFRSEVKAKYHSFAKRELLTKYDLNDLDYMLNFLKVILSYMEQRDLSYLLSDFFTLNDKVDSFRHEKLEDVFPEFSRLREFASTQK